MLVPVSHWGGAALLESYATAAQPIRIAVLGDSIGEGDYAGATDPQIALNGFAGLIQTRVQSLYGNGGEGIVGPWATVSPRWTYGGSWANLNNGGWFAGLFQFGRASNTAGDATTVTGLVADNIDILWCSTTATDLFTVSVDGGTAVSVGKATEGSGFTHGVTNIPCTLGTHSIQIFPPTNGKYALPWAVSANVGSSGARASRMARASSRASGILQFGTIRSPLATTPPNLTILEWSTNEYIGQETPATIGTWFTNLTSHLISLGSDVLFVTGPPQHDESQVIPLSTYINQIHTVAAAQTSPKFKGMIDVYARWGSSWTTANARGFMDNNANGFIHPNAAGHADIYAAIASVRA